MKCARPRAPVAHIHKEDWALPRQILVATPNGKVPSASASHGETAYRSIRRDLLDGTIPPGSRLFEVRIAERLKVSRTPVREALRRLESDGFVQRVGERTLVATPAGTDDLGDIGLLRIEIDGLVARLAATRATARDWAELRRALDQIERAGDDALALNRAHAEFHRAIYAVGFGPRMFLFVDNHVLPYLDVAVNTGGSKVTGPISHRAHSQLLRSLSSGDVERAVRASREHAEGALAAAKSAGL
jgi:DNA-binding GntR family transcriptional regulator